MSVERALSEKLMFTTVRIESIFEDGSSATGTGFYFNYLNVDNSHVPAIVTNKHVVEGACRGRIPFTLQGEDGQPKIGKFINYDFNDFRSLWIDHPDPDVDLCIFPIGPVIRYFQDIQQPIAYLGLHKELVATPEIMNEFTSLEEVLMIGYPNGIWDYVNNLPIFRKGITATDPKVDYCGKNEFMIDAACFPGSSGSPVFLFNQGTFTTKSGEVRYAEGGRIALLGVLYAGPQFTATGEIKVVNIPSRQEPVVFSRIPNNLGLVIKASKLLDFEEILKQRQLTETN
ncbi:serine protease [Brevibacillus sp. BC25]|uniref:S1 family peptidase n=1 Tax=Brevibacillus sp. BC25 TaxID=1144308 RepID=UPI000270DD58|nr:serine protease [Brevibacillus sp. BC25]EJL31777.1 hypothetical protein PMI05_00542 [Brevibacillus sp. BC25]